SGLGPSACGAVLAAAGRAIRRCPLAAFEVLGSVLGPLNGAARPQCRCDLGRAGGLAMPSRRYGSPRAAAARGASGGPCDTGLRYDLPPARLRRTPPRPPAAPPG